MLGESTNWQRILPTTIEGLEKVISRPLSSESSLGWCSKILTKKSPNLVICTALTCLKNKYHGVFVNVKEIYQFISHIFHLRELLPECSIRLYRHKKKSLKVAKLQRCIDFYSTLYLFLRISPSSQLPHQNWRHWPWGLELFCPREEHGVQSCKCLCSIFQTPSSEWLTCAYWNFTLTPESFHSSYSYHMYLNRLCVGTVYNNLGDITTRRCRGRRIGMVRDGGSFLPPTRLSRVSLLSGSRLPVWMCRLHFIFWQLSLLVVWWQWHLSPLEQRGKKGKLVAYILSGVSLTSSSSSSSWRIMCSI